MNLRNLKDNILKSNRAVELWSRHKFNGTGMSAFCFGRRKTCGLHDVPAEAGYTGLGSASVVAQQAPSALSYIGTPELALIPSLSCHQMSGHPDKQACRLCVRSYLYHPLKL